jgi:hypothetical protein
MRRIGPVIDSDDLVPEFLGEAVEICERNRLVESGVVDEDVEPAEARHNVDSQLLHRGLIGEFAGEGGRAHLMPRCEVARHTLRLLAALRVHDRDMRAFLRERTADALPKSAVATRHQSHRATKVHRVSLHLGLADDQRSGRHIVTATLIPHRTRGGGFAGYLRCGRTRTAVDVTAASFAIPAT